MDSTLANYLKALRTPSGAPASGSVDWEKMDLLGSTTKIRLEWDPTRLSVSGSGENQTWHLLAHKTADGWSLVEASENVGGGTLLAKFRWAGKQIEDVALGACPNTSWNVVAKPRARGMGR